MTTVTFHKTTAEFLAAHEAFLEKNYYLVYPLLELIRKAKKDNLKISAAFSFEDGGSLAIGLQAGPFLTLYSTKWNEDVLSLIEQTVPFGKMGSDIFFSGTFELITELLDRSGKEYKEISARNVYECRRLATKIKISQGKCGRADISNVDRIADLSFEFQKDEYGDRNPHDREYMLTHVVEPGIMNGSIVNWIVNNEVVSIAQVMIDEENKPIIGHFFTDPAYRGKGYGTSLIWSVTDAIFKDFEICGLVTKLTNTAANAIFRKVGYEQKYRWVKASFVGK
jgi:GNAT superfamily N-acetyltransferase